ncbi:MAG: preprotein translocase subunit SecE [Gemmatimonadaceae bacterium]
MADVVAPRTATESGGGRMATIRGIPAFYRSVVAEMKKVTWPEPADVRRATIAIIIFVLILGLFIYVLDVALQGLLANLIPRLFVGR